VAVAAPVETAKDESAVVSDGLVPEEYICFGTIDKTSPECQQCQFNNKCAEKAGK
jgi:hypothetical protein